MNGYYVMESVRDLLINKFDVKSSSENSVPFPSWNRYPCPIIKKCELNKQTKCVGYVSVFVNTDTVRWLYLEICFFRERQRAFIRTDSLQMRKLFELGIITNELILEKEFF
jgi:hypothetical protein